MALSANEQKLFDLALAALPYWFQEDKRSMEHLGLAAKEMGAAWDQLVDWMDNTLILQAVGPTGFDPDWLNQHAVDRGTTRQSGETDAALRERIRNVPDHLTRQTILDAAQAIIDAESISGTVYMVELRWWKIFLNALLVESGTGGTFTAGTGSEFLFEPDTAFATILPVFLDIAWWPISHKLKIVGAASAGNDGEFPITALDEDAVVYTNASGVAEYDATVSWGIQEYDQDGNLWDGYRSAYCSRGYRICHDGLPNSFVLILPYGSTAGTAASVTEMLRQKKAGGILAFVEYRQSP